MQDRDAEEAGGVDIRMEWYGGFERQGGREEGVIRRKGKNAAEISSYGQVSTRAEFGGGVEKGSIHLRSIYSRH